jgi:hypothetical protein
VVDGPGFTTTSPRSGSLGNNASLTILNAEAGSDVVRHEGGLGTF